VFVDGQAMRSDVTGAPPAYFYDQEPTPRRTVAVPLTAGPHTLLVRCVKAADLVWHQWCLSVTAVTLDGDVAFEVTADAR
jgi:hypothetical protein